MAVEGAGHGAFNSPDFDAAVRPGVYGEVIARADRFLAENGFEKRGTISVRVAAEALAGTGG